ncbi:hydroxyacid dehydrogenase [Gilliamella sp. W8126]|uniref:D-isomer specific 2-hydroxyacid dehydrogenase family protein n=1 Tax=unclassified Gilliamella TaxID=2685620 RepID=UPI0018DB8BC0|nr:D-isomer specific 2-hydroxyacid dehydrogenase family protein [uncultured Gilliamella sp.]MBI0006012.1 hydroxyacid dehydrogenase [Gilliamella sp. W8126]MBI0038649.1 hydroxyacid dehydrogenase [Gilliamella sp. B14384G10]MBI0040942.1 hydroxyacid dehydrogenase [Gilliamella sp. B14384G7]MBI0052609.1 hydroxyacid dehydrogenase [Gilliamella sp. B14384G13]MBI0054904.1 hydroxyacid dehydrogenase [Gilliamella sp. B14384H2]
MKNYKIAIINSSSFGKYFPNHLERLEKIGEVKHFTFENNIPGKELAEALQDFNIVIASVRPFFNKEFFDNKKQPLLLLSRHGIGFNNVDVVAAKEHGTIVTIVPPLVERDAVAENAVTNLLALIRQTVQSQEAVKSDEWKKRASFLGINVTGKVIGIIGCGNIGSRVAEIFKHGFNARLLVVDPKVNVDWANKNNIEIVELDYLLQNADIISLNASLNETSYHILKAPQFSLMKKGVYITNTARAELIDETALINALDNGTVAGHATDVMYVEPSYSDHPLVKHPKVLVTPHTSAYAIECLQGMGEKCVQDVENFVNNLELQSVVS